MDVLTLGYLLLYCGNSLCLNLLGTTLLELQQQVNSTISSIAWVFAAQSIGVAIGSAIGGPWYDRPTYQQTKPAHLLLAFSLFLVVCFTFVVPLMKSLYMLTVIALFQGCWIGFARMGSNCLILRHHGDKAAPYMQSLHFLGGVGAWIAPMLVRYFVEEKEDGMMMMYVYSVASMTLVPIIIWMILHGFSSSTNINAIELKSTRKTTSKQSQINENVSNQNDNVKVINSDVNIKSSKQDSPFSLFMILLAVLMFLENGSRFVLQSYLVPYGLNCKNLKISHADSLLLSATYSGAFAVGRLLGIFLSVYLYAGTLLFIDVAGTAIASFILLVYPETSYTILIGSSALFGLSMSSIFPTAIVYANRLASDGNDGVRLSTLMISASFGSIVLAKYVGYGFDNGHEGISLMNQTNFVSCTISVILMIFLKSLESTHNKCFDKLH